jgi:y4mF family transcriptional regulator
MSNLSPFIKYYRKRYGFTQEELALKAGVGLRFIRELEQGKETVQLDKVEQVLSLFGFELMPTKQRLNPYKIFSTYLNKSIKITLKNKVTKYGIIVSEIFDPKEGTISGWEFISSSHMTNSHLKQYAGEIITHSDIQEIEEQE